MIELGVRENNAEEPHSVNLIGQRAAIFPSIILDDIKEETDPLFTGQLFTDGRSHSDRPQKSQVGPFVVELLIEDVLG